jgi:hypothetical protein
MRRIHLVHEKCVILAMQISSRNQKYLKNGKFRIFSLKNCQEKWAVRIHKFYKFQSHAQLYEIHGNQVISAHANFNRTSKILGSVQQWKFIRGYCNERHFSGYVRSPKNFSASPAAIFVDAHRYRKINKGLRADSCEADEDSDSGFKELLYLSGVSRL